MSEDGDRALEILLRALKAKHYSFITPTPATHARVVARPGAGIANTLRDVFGWSLPFRRDEMAEEVVTLLRDADLLEQRGDLLASRVRVSSLGDDLMLHSAYPTTQHDAVFFGPDSYRFANFLRGELPRFAPRRHIVDIGAGAGVGAMTAARCLPDAFVTLTDINPGALRLAAVNWAAAGLGERVRFALTDALDGVESGGRPIDCIIANPPYIADPLHRSYRDGGDMHGAALSLSWAKAAGDKLAPGGVLLLYTGSAIVGGEDAFRRAALEALREFDVSYREIDPDVFGEELEREDYADVDRIAVVGLIAVKL